MSKGPLPSESAPAIERTLLFGTERYAVPILAPLARAIRARGGDCAWCLPGVQTELDDPAPRLGSMAAARAYGARSILCAANVLPPALPGVKVQLFHGFSVGKRSPERGHYRVRGLFDLYCTQGPDTTLPFQALAREHGHFLVEETGWPKLDPLFRGELAGEIADLRARAAGRPVVAFGSTFTESLSAAPHLFEQVARLVAGGRWYWLLTLHPKCAPALQHRYRSLAGEHARFVESERMLALLGAADVLVADTSSIVSEFLTTRRPVVAFRHRHPDPAMFDLQAPDALPQAIERALAPDAAWRAAIERHADRIHPGRDGHASERVLAATHAVVTGERRAPRRKPWHPLRRLQLAWRFRGRW